MQLSQFEALTQYMDLKTPIYLKYPASDPNGNPVSQLKFAANHRDLLLVIGSKPLSLGQLMAQTAQVSHQALLLRPNGQSILGFQLDKHYYIYLN
ncbi:hypothetical protein SAMN05216341_101381 [Leuconostocaceae bacterium R-53105]|uniref:Uncharacterized protein n=2 Tax=Convivina intestini TaxID=1505726 RepID=A0A2U1DFM2_9LACO|nr:hypothetical protein [Convivina intestini]PVY86470.1 hypothetical protein C7384_101389 [Convivina intestini]CAH1850132.1 hypothetical protein R077811_00027 [Convivina intestini]CAH1854996.1 hypothetical protein R078131_01121 [Convivina intestini]SDB83954.1 hypothetical protein SAMN05216341_101381 [Leuconostocaceae bacterium R-53105]